MCGIIYIKRLDGKKARRSIIKRYEEQKSRGSQGFGFVSITENKITGLKRGRTEKEIKDKMIDDNADTILFHHRFPTSTPNLEEATHPIEVKHESLDFDYLVVHNGVISNANELYEEYDKKGFIFNTEVITKYYTTKKKYYSSNIIQFNDSESFAIDLALTIEGKQEQLKSKGSIAFIALQLEKNTKEIVSTFYGKNYQNPLKVWTDKNLISIASEGQGISIKEHTLFCIDSATGKITEKSFPIGYYQIPKTTSPTAYNSYDYDDDYGYGEHGNYNFNHKKDDSNKTTTLLTPPNPAIESTKTKKSTKTLTEELSDSGKWERTEDENGVVTWKPIHKKESDTSDNSDDKLKEIDDAMEEYYDRREQQRFHKRMKGNFGQTIYDHGVRLMTDEEIQHILDTGTIDEALTKLDYQIEIIRNTLDLNESEMTFFASDSEEFISAEAETAKLEEKLYNRYEAYDTINEWQFDTCDTLDETVGNPVEVETLKEIK